MEVVIGFLAWAAGYILFDGPLGVLLTGYFWLTIPQALFRIFQFIAQSRLEVKKMFINNLVLLFWVITGVAILVIWEISFEKITVILGGSFTAGLLWQLFDSKVFSWKISLKKLRLPNGYIQFAANGVLRELLGTISSRAYILLTAGFVGYAESALVGIASRYANLIYLPNSAYQGLLYPKACELANKGYLSGMFGFYRRSISWMQAAFIPYVILLLVFGSAGIVLLHGIEYIQALPFFAVLIISGAFISPFGHAFGSVCQAAGHPELVTKLVFINSIVNLALSVLLVMTWGVWGAVLAPVITDIMGLVLISIVLRKTFNTGIMESVPRILSRGFSLIKIINRQFKTRGELV